MELTVWNFSIHIRGFERDWIDLTFKSTFIVSFSSYPPPPPPPPPSSFSFALRKAIAYEKLSLITHSLAISLSISDTLKGIYEVSTSFENFSKRKMVNLNRKRQSLLFCHFFDRENHKNAPKKIKVIKVIKIFKFIPLRVLIYIFIIIFFFSNNAFN